MRPARRASHTPDNRLLFLPGVFNETLGLLYDAHNYFQNHGAEEQAMLQSRHHNDFTNEMARVTMRLTSVMAWIMVRRAVTAGRIEEAKAAVSYRLDAGADCRRHEDEVKAELPYYMAYLSERSHELYERVFRLDEMVYGDRNKAH